MKLTFLGTGTSHGVPTIGCDCKVCTSQDPHNKRLRSSAYIQCENDTRLLIDVGPEFRIQALENKIRKIDAVLITHTHADHIFGLDDLRMFSADLKNIPGVHLNPKLDRDPIPIYANKKSLEDIKFRFNYMFVTAKEGGGHAKIELHEAQNKFYIQDIEIHSIPMLHGHTQTSGWLICETRNGIKHSIAYLTDCNYISNESIKLINENCGILEHLVIDGLRIATHTTHFSFIEALENANKLNAKHVWLTHMTHNTSHDETTEFIKENLYKFENLKKAESVLPAYDKLEIFC